MSGGLTLQQYKERNIKKLKPEEAMPEEEYNELSSIVSQIAQDEQEQLELKGFTRKEVTEAAQFSLKGRLSGIETRNLDVSDSPVYYNLKTKKSRWFRNRKKLDDAATLLIEKAKARRMARIQDELRKVTEKEQKLIDAARDRSKNMEDVLNSFHIPDMENIPQGFEWKEDEEYTASLEEGMSSEIFDSIQYKEPEFETDMDKLFAGQAVKDRMNPQVELVDKGTKIMLSGIDQTLAREIPSAEILIQKIRESYQSKLVAEIEKPGKTREDMMADKTRLEAQAQRQIAAIRRAYADYAAGKISPEAFKLFMNPALMGVQTTGERILYSKLVGVSKEKAFVPDEDQDEQYRETLLNVVNTHNYDPKSICFQVGSKAPSALTLANGNAAVAPIVIKQQIFHKDQFVHFHGKNCPSNADRRLYITAKPEKQIEVIRAWNEALAKHGDLKDFLHFKMRTNYSGDRKESIVLYLSDNADHERINAFMEDFKELCSENDVLETGENTLCTGEFISDGVTSSTEFHPEKVVDVLGKEERYDKNQYKKLAYGIRKGIDPKPEDPDPNPPKALFSYNTYLVRAQFFANALVRKKQNIPEGEPIPNTNENLRLLKRYFADFIRLAGTDPLTMRNL